MKFEVDKRSYEIYDDANSFARTLIKNTRQRLVYHYTSDSALKSILENSTLRLSDIKYMNDESEMKYFYDLAKKYLEGTNKFDKIFKDEIIKVIDLFDSVNRFGYSELKVCSIKSNIFVISFSLNSDCLPLWVYYTKNPNSIGYSIEFDRALITRVIEKSTKKDCFTGKVIYEESIQKKVLDKLFNYFYRLYLQEDENNKRDVIVSCEQVIKLLSLFCKSPYFKNEEEFRIVISSLTLKTKNKVIGGNNTKFRLQKGIFVPYTEINFKNKKNCIEGIKISPTQKDILAKYGLKELLEELEYLNVDVEQSKIPLRF